MIAPRSSGWTPGFAHRERGVSFSGHGDSGWRPGFAHRERGVGVQHWLVSWRGAWVFLVSPGCLRGRQFDSHHRLSGLGCSRWARGTDFKFRLRIPDDSTSEIQLLLPLGRVSVALWSRFLNSLEFEDICTSALCPGDGELVGNMTLVTEENILSLAHIGGKWIEDVGLRIFCDRLLRDLPWGSASCGPAGETTANFTFWTFVQKLRIRDSRRQDRTFTGAYGTICIFGVKIVFLAYGLTFGNLSLSFRNFLVPFLEFSETYLAKVPILSTSRRLLETYFAKEPILRMARGRLENGSVAPGGWRRTRWLKRRGITTSCLGLGPSVGGAFGSVGGVDGASGCVGGGDDASVVVDEKYGRFGGYLAPCEAGRGVRLRAEDPVLTARPGAIVGHGERQGHCGLTAVGLVVSGRLSSCLPVCPPPVRSAPGISSFPFLSLPLPPAHSELGCDDVGDRILVSGACASVARPCLFALSVPTCSSNHRLVVCILQARVSCLRKLLFPPVVE